MIDAETRAELAVLFVDAYDDVYKCALAATSGNVQAARDVVQEAFQAATVDWPKLRGQGQQRQAAWLKRVCLNKLVDQWRREARARRSLGAIFAHYSPEPDPADLTLQRIALEKCWKVMSVLPPMQQRIAYLHWWEGLTLERAARLFDIKPTTARVHLHKARKALIEAVGDDVPFSLRRNGAPSERTVEQERRRGA